MSNTNFITILIAEDNEVSREMMRGVLKTQGFNTVPAEDGDSAIAALKNQSADLALVDINMAPKGGLEFIRHLVANGIDLPVVIVTGDESSDILLEAGSLGVQRVLHKPVKPDTLIKVVKQVLKRRGFNPDHLGVEVHDTKFNHETLMQKAIELAAQNAKLKKGRPYGAVVADSDGHILGEGVNGITSRVDPIAHAEVMAIRQAAEKLGRTDLKDCILYCSAYPTKVGAALIESVGIGKVYYGLSHTDIESVRE
ncbi:MAG: response regulator, partial [Bdellovibrionales bacterium]